MSETKINPNQILGGIGADTSLSNLSDAGKITSAYLAMPGLKYDDISMSFDNNYVAPSNGYFIYSQRSGATTRWVCFDLIDTNNNNESSYRTVCWTTTNTSAEGCVIIPVAKGDTVRLTGTLTGEVIISRFVYAKGSESEWSAE